MKINGITGRKTSRNGGLNIRCIIRGVNQAGPRGSVGAAPPHPPLVPVFNFNCPVLFDRADPVVRSRPPGRLACSA